MKRLSVMILMLSAAAAALSGAFFFLERTISPDTQGSGFLEFGRGSKALASRTLNEFKKNERENDFELSYRWKDFSGRDCRATFSLVKAQIVEAEREFGYSQEELDQHLKPYEDKLKLEQIASLRAYLRDQMAKSPYGRYMALEDKNPLTFDLKISAPEEVRDEARTEFRRLQAGLAKEQERWLSKMKKELEAQQETFFKSRGLRVNSGQISVNYEFCVRQNKPRVRQAFLAIRDSRENFNLNDFLSVLLAFVQEIRHENPPLQEGQRNILGFWVPPRVLADNSGDCDSKGATFASLWTNFKNYPVLILKIPEHLFVGLAIPSVMTEGTLTLRGLRYTLCEVVGPEGFPPGMISAYSWSYLQSGRFQYELID